MKAKYIGKTDVSLTNGTEYDVVSVESGWFRVIDDNGDDYIFPPDQFVVIEE